MQFSMEVSGDNETIASGLVFKRLVIVLYSRVGLAQKFSIATIVLIVTFCRPVCPHTNGYYWLVNVSQVRFGRIDIVAVWNKKR